jgi:DNA-directed RNA polymerase specialized sigma24 family protein
MKPGKNKGKMESTMSRIFSHHPALEPLALRKHSGAFDTWFSRYRGLLHSTACQILRSTEHAELAVENSWLTASRNLPRFDREGALRSWLVRVLINEALAILRQGKQHAITP